MQDASEKEAGRHVVHFTIVRSHATLSAPSGEMGEGGRAITRWYADPYQNGENNDENETSAHDPPRHLQTPIVTR